MIAQYKSLVYRRIELKNLYGEIKYAIVVDGLLFVMRKLGE